MPATDSNIQKEDNWQLLQQPDRPAGGMDPRFQLLLSALDMGWRIEEPVYLRPRWSENGPRVYHFILRRSLLESPRMISVPASPAVERFVQNEGLQVSR